MRGVGYAIGIKNVCFSEGFDDYSTARVRLEVIGGEPVVLVHTAAAEVGPGPGHRAGADRPHRAGRRAGDDRAPPTRRSAAPARRSASRQTYMTGGAVQGGVRGGRGERLLELRRRAPAGCGCSPAARCVDRRRRGASPTWSTLLGDEADRGDRRVAAPADRRRSTRRPGRATRTCSTRSPRTGRSSTSTSSWAWSGSSSSPRAQDVGKAINPQAVRRPDPRRHRAGARAGA